MFKIFPKVKYNCSKKKKKLKQKPPLFQRIYSGKMTTKFLFSLYFILFFYCVFSSCIQFPFQENEKNTLGSISMLVEKKVFKLNDLNAIKDAGKMISEKKKKMMILEDKI